MTAIVACVYVFFGSLGGVFVASFVFAESPFPKNAKRGNKCFKRGYTKTTKKCNDCFHHSFDETSHFTLLLHHIKNP